MQNIMRQKFNDAIEKEIQKVCNEIKHHISGVISKGAPHDLKSEKWSKNEFYPIERTSQISTHESEER